MNLVCCCFWLGLIFDDGYVVGLIVGFRGRMFVCCVYIVGIFLGFGSSYRKL